MKHKKWIVIDKEVGQTPLQAVEAYKAWAPGMKEAKMAYAGRLDPMASGKLLVLIGDECKQQARYHGLDKEYLVEVLIGVGSDSGDVLGRLSFNDESVDIINRIIRRVAKSQTGPFTPPYPVFSSKTVDGVPLHTWALRGELDQITVPAQDGYIYGLSIVSIKTFSGDELYKTAVDKIHSLPPVTDDHKALGADFRRHEVTADWESFFTKHSEHQFKVATLRVTASGGTYMRSLAEEIGKKLGVPALALSIHRTQIGRYFKLPIGGLWLKLYK